MNLFLLFAVLLNLNESPFNENDSGQPKKSEQQLKIEAELNKGPVLSKQCNTLFIDKQYDSVISISTNNKSNYYFAEQARYNIIACEYFKGNHLYSRELLKALNNSYSSYFSGLNALNSGSVAMYQYLEVDSNRVTLVESVKEKYRTDSSALPDAGIELLDLYVYDIWIRRNAINQFAGTNWSESKFDSAARIERAELFKFYKKLGRIPGPDEIGKQLFNFQFILLAHDHNSKHRKYYLRLIRRAVRNGACENERLASFDLRSQYIRDGQSGFIKTYPERLEKAKKKYKLPENYSWGLF